MKITIHTTSLSRIVKIFDALDLNPAEVATETAKGLPCTIQAAAATTVTIEPTNQNLVPEGNK